MIEIKFICNLKYGEPINIGVKISDTPPSVLAALTDNGKGGMLRKFSEAIANALCCNPIDTPAAVEDSAWNRVSRNMFDEIKRTGAAPNSMDNVFDGTVSQQELPL